METQKVNDKPVNKAELEKAIAEHKRMDNDHAAALTKYEAEKAEYDALMAETEVRQQTLAKSATVGSEQAVQELTPEAVEKAAYNRTRRAELKAIFAISEASRKAPVKPVEPKALAILEAKIAALEATQKATN